MEYAPSIDTYLEKVGNGEAILSVHFRATWFHIVYKLYARLETVCLELSMTVFISSALKVVKFKYKTTSTFSILIFRAKDVILVIDAIPDAAT